MADYETFPDSSSSAVESADIAVAPAWTPGVALRAPQLYHRCDPAGLDVDADGRLLASPPALVGQQRATEAIALSMGIRRKGFNLFVLGPSGTGRHTLVRELLRRQAEREPTPADWCYVNNFSDPHRPLCLSLPAGRGRALRDAVQKVMVELRAALPAAFERDEYRARRDLIDQQLKKRHEEAFGALQRRANEKQIALIRTPVGLALAPTRNGEIMPSEKFQEIPEAERNKIKADIEALQAELETIVRTVPDWERDHREALRKLNRETTTAAVGRLFEDIRHAFADLAEVTAYLHAVENDIVENAEGIIAAEHPSGEGDDDMPENAPAKLVTRRYQVNLVVDNGGLSGAPVVFEDRPTHQTLVGRIEHFARFGALITDFNLLVPGALHRANGGYLVLDAERLLMGAFGYDSLKRALRAEEVRMESLEQLLSLASTVSLEPQPVPLDVKVVLIGPPTLYYLLAELDPEFKTLFKISAEFEGSVDRTPATVALYARVIADSALREKLKPLDRDAAARLIEHASRESADAEKLSTRMAGLLDVLREADHVAGTAGKAIIGRDDIQKTLDARLRRSDHIYRRFQEEIVRGTIHVETAGEQIGQVNGLAVISIGGVTFGHPSRITARVQVGHGEVIDIEREVTLGGPLHSKGVLILTGFLGGRFGKTAPLSVRASLVFEQSYSGVEGDSASSAETYALLSALSDLPIRQGFAVTGSIDQHGLIQAIGGVNEKIEGFFDLCTARGLDGQQGVLIPASNVKHLMLRQDVVDACEAGRFAVIPVATVDQGIEILTGVPAGELNLMGQYPAGSVNQRIAARLAAFAASGIKRESRPRESRRERGARNHD
jgi:lon-related putative ATP-dependent protease